jgi:hypothetical protein
MASPQETSFKKVIPKKSMPEKIIFERTTSKNSASEVSATKTDYLTSLPPEILLKIIPLSPAASFYELAHTSAHLRAFIKLYAPTICNCAIENHFSHISTNLDTQQISGWLVPRRPIFSQEEESLRKLKTNVMRNEFWRVWKSDHLQIELTEPGPQYLLFPETIAPFMDPSYVFICPPNGHPFKKFGIISYEQMLNRGLSKSIHDFIRATDEELAQDVHNCKFWRRRLYNTKELTWYYGVP